MAGVLHFLVETLPVDLTAAAYDVDGAVRVDGAVEDE